jgi:microsomal dipeptidase-like Zn-dependent dipeptidase
MDRRQFLRYSAYYGFSLTLGNLFSCAAPPKLSKDDQALIKGIRFIDAHSHPDWSHPITSDFTSTIKTIKELGMVASCFAAVGDHIFISGGRLKGFSEYHNTMDELEWWKDKVRWRKIRLVLKASDIPDSIGPDDPPGAILSIEGGDPLEGRAARVNEFYRFGVRMITVIHDRNNELGDTMASYKNINPGPMNNGLTRSGYEVVERMWSLGMVVDVAHAHSETLKQIAEIAERSHKPLLDSHTSPCPNEKSLRCGRFRKWNDMELVAKTGGVVCTWPQGYKWGSTFRKTFLDWAKEILVMKSRLGIDHVGLGTDGGPISFNLIENYRDIRDLVHLVRAMQEVGFSHGEIAAYMGGNFYRVLQSCIG